MHSAESGQLVPHEPQLSVVVRSVQTPLHSFDGALHAGAWHVPATQSGVLPEQSVLVQHAAHTPPPHDSVPVGQA